MRDKPNIVVIGTGGTIAGHGERSANALTYTCSVLTIDEILAAIPDVPLLANLRTEQLLQTGSENFDNEHLVMIGRRVSEVLKDDDVDGVILTHGTDTIEETAYFLHLTLKSAKPVVVVGSMRPPSAMSSDASLNLYNAISVAIHPASRGMGTLVVSNDEIHTARDVTKSNSFKLEAFRSPYGALGYVVEGQARYYRTPSRDHTMRTPWSIDDIEVLPKVDIVYAYGALDEEVIGTVASDADGLVYAGTGNGNVAERIVGPLRNAARNGVQVVRASRTGTGVVIRNGAQPDDDYGWIVVDDQAPQKARILLMLAMLNNPGDRNTLQAAFYRY
jgi:glutamin-(asparagin-)ase